MAGETLPTGSTNTQGLADWASPYISNYLGKAQALSETPYQPYKGPLTAGTSPLQDKMFQGIANLAFPSNLGQSFSSTGAYQLPQFNQGMAPQPVASAYNAPNMGQMPSVGQMPSFGQPTAPAPMQIPSFMPTTQQGIMGKGYPNTGVPQQNPSGSISDLLNQLTPNRAPSAAKPVGLNDPFYQSPEYQNFQKSQEGMMGTMDMYDSPYFGMQGSGSTGRAMDEAYEKYMGRKPADTGDGVVPKEFSLVDLPVGSNEPKRPTPSSIQDIMKMISQRPANGSFGDTPETFGERRPMEMPYALTQPPEKRPEEMRPIEMRPEEMRPYDPYPEELMRRPVPQYDPYREEFEKPSVEMPPPPMPQGSGLAGLMSAMPQQQAQQVPGIASQYMNPYLQSVLTPQLDELRRQNDITNTQTNAKLTSAGAFGGGRQAIMNAENARNLMQEQNKTVGQGYASAYDKAMQQFNAEQGQARDLANLIGNAGAQQRGITSEGIAADKAEFEAQRQFPFQQVQFQRDMISGLPTGSVTNTPANLTGMGAFLSALGGGTAAASALGYKNVGELLSSLGLNLGQKTPE